MPNGLGAGLLNGFTDLAPAAKGLKGVGVADPNCGEAVVLVVSNGFSAAGEGALTNGPPFCAVGGSVNRTCLLKEPRGAPLPPRPLIVVPF